MELKHAPTKLLLLFRFYWRLMPSHQLQGGQQILKLRTKSVGRPDCCMQ